MTVRCGRDKRRAPARLKAKKPKFVSSSNTLKVFPAASRPRSSRRPTKIAGRKAPRARRPLARKGAHNRGRARRVMERSGDASGERKRQKSGLPTGAQRGRHTAAVFPLAWPRSGIRGELRVGSARAARHWEAAYLLDAMWGRSAAWRGRWGQRDSAGAHSGHGKAMSERPRRARRRR